MKKNYIFKKWLLATYPVQKSKIFYGACYLLLVTCLGCGYTFRSNLPSHIKTIYIEKFNNEIEFISESTDYSSYFPGLENDLTEVVEERFIFEGTLKLVDEKAKADLVLTGDLTDYIKQPLRYSDDEVEEYRLSIVVNCEIKDVKEDEIFWKDSIVGDTTYFVIGTLAKTETEAVNQSVEDLARRIVEKTVVKW